MDYEYDIFISYRRSDDDWVRWTQEHFVRLLRSLLHPSLGRVRIFIDHDIEAGTAWPSRLAQALARSRLMVPILCRDYFRSEWCRMELAVMHHREQIADLRSAINPWGLIIPVIIDDGDCFPSVIRQMQSEKIHEYANPFMRDGSPKQEAFAERLRTRICPAIHAALAHVPPFDPGWELIAYGQLIDLFHVHDQTQTTVPTMSMVGGS